MDDLDVRLRGRLRALADAVPVSGERPAAVRLSSPTTRSRTTGFSPIATAAAVLLVAVIGVAVVGRGMTPATGTSPVPVLSPSVAATATSVPSASPSPSTEVSPTPPTAATRPPADVALPYPDGCSAYGLSPRRCAYIVNWALAEAGVAADEATVQLLGDPECEGKPAGCMPIRLGGTFVVRVRVTRATGQATDHPVFCFLGGDASLLCAETPRIRVSSPMSGYHDVPCGAEPGPGKCASPVPTIAASAAAEAVPLSVPSLTIAIDHAGTYAVDVGDAILPNGILSEASATLANDRRVDVLIPQGIQLDVVGEDGQPLSNLYAHGWRPGTERVHVRLAFTVESFDLGTSLIITNVSVR